MTGGKGESGGVTEIRTDAVKEVVLWCWIFEESEEMEQQDAEVLPQPRSVPACPCRVPVQRVEIQLGGTWGEMRRTFNNMYAANGGPFNTWPLPLRITSMLGDVVYAM